MKVKLAVKMKSIKWFALIFSFILTSKWFSSPISYQQIFVKQTRTGRGDNDIDNDDDELDEEQLSQGEYPYIISYFTLLSST